MSNNIPERLWPESLVRQLVIHCAGNLQNLEAILDQWRTQIPADTKDPDSFAIAFACWAFYDEQAQAYRASGASALQLVELYKNRPYISTNPIEQ